MKGASRETTDSGEGWSEPEVVDADGDSTRSAGRDDSGAVFTGSYSEKSPGGRENREYEAESHDIESDDERTATELLSSDPYYALRFYEETLNPHGTPKERIEIPKENLPALPDRFERTRLAKMPDESLGSYRDMNASVQSSHVHEYPDHWELHVDCFNPHYRPLEHALVDTGISGQAWDTVTALVVGTLATLSVTRDLTIDSSRLGDFEFGSLGTSLLDAAVSSLSLGMDVLTLV